MKPEQIFIGSIRKCTKYEMHTTFSMTISIGGAPLGTDSFGYIEQDSILEKENAVLVKLEKGGYVDLDTFNSALDYLRIYKDVTKHGYRTGGLILSTSPNKIGSIFVDESSVKPYYQTKDKVKNITFGKLKKEVDSKK